LTVACRGRVERARKEAKGMNMFLFMGFLKGARETDAKQLV